MRSPGRWARSPLDDHAHLPLPEGDHPNGVLKAPARVSVQGTRTDDDACMLLAIREAGGAWIIHSLDSGAVRLAECVQGFGDVDPS
ncbi:MAG: hypothetical protein ACRDRS_26225 [Pseudonocardiaceae bacterium]